MAVMSRLFASLALLALAGAVVLFALVAGSATSGESVACRWLADIRPLLPWAALLVAAVTMAGSLYYSEVAGFTPCELCWYQRICAYPLVLLLAVSLVRRDSGVRPYVIALAAVGLPISAYHSIVQWFPPEGGTSFCTPEAPCTTRWVFEFGFVTLPFMAFCAFTFVIASMVALGAGRTTPERARGEKGREEMAE
ncbi:MAG: hypothetical protein KatS3mg008_2178 [Acidimicrobiales bacterium]|nr:MAG: hypothetical protein KatS3mg008_2178 [Acidimicrobiales bacterium]